MIQANDLIDSFNHTESTEGNFKGLTKREYFAAKSDIPWAQVIEILNIKYPDKLNKHTVQDVVEYQASVRVLQADALINALNQTNHE